MANNKNTYFFIGVNLRQLISNRVNVNQNNKTSDSESNLENLIELINKSEML